MTLEQLRIFVAVAARGNMTRAADDVALTQSAVSAAIAALERRHAVRLFDRVGRGLVLSDAGAAFLPEAQAVLARAAAAEGALADLAGLRRGRLAIAASQTVATYWLPPRLARFAAAHPGLDLTLIDGNSAQAAARVLAGDADLAIVEAPVTDPALAMRVVGGDRLGLYVAPDHPLAGRTPDAEDLRAATWILREPGSGSRDHLLAALERLGIGLAALDVRLVLPSNGAVLAAVEAGGVIAGISDLSAAPRVGAGRIVRLGFDLPDRPFTLLLHHARHRSRAAAAFLAEAV